MAGHAADCELGTRFAVATEADDAAIRQLLRETPMHGGVRVGFGREPSYASGTGLAGAEDRTIVAFEGGELVCMGRCTRRECWVNGEARAVGYLGELRLGEQARGRFGILRDGYRFFAELERDDPAAVYFTSIAADNERARRLLELGARGLPRYTFLAELETVLVTVPSRLRPASAHWPAGCRPWRAGRPLYPSATAGRGKMRFRFATLGDVPEILRLLNGRRHQLAAVWTKERLLALERHGLPTTRFLLGTFDEKAVACAALWDQRPFRQTVVHGYSSGLALARPVVNLAGRLFGTPRLPRAGSVLAHAFLSPLAMAPEAERLLPDFIKAFFPLAAEVDAEFLTLALSPSDSRLPELRRRFRTRSWRSRLYRVEWPDSASCDLEKSATIVPDVALL